MVEVAITARNVLLQIDFSWVDFPSKERTFIIPYHLTILIALFHRVQEDIVQIGPDHHMSTLAGLTLILDMDLFHTICADNGLDSPPTTNLLSGGSIS